MDTMTSAEVGPVERPLGPLPQWAIREACQGVVTLYFTADHMCAYALQERAAERERWEKAKAALVLYMAAGLGNSTDHEKQCAARLAALEVLRA